MSGNRAVEVHVCILTQVVDVGVRSTHQSHFCALPAQRVQSQTQTQQDACNIEQYIQYHIDYMETDPSRMPVTHTNTT